MKNDGFAGQETTKSMRNDGFTNQETTKSKKNDGFTGHGTTKSMKNDGYTDQETTIATNDIRSTTKSNIHEIVLPGRKSAFRVGIWPDCYRGGTEIDPPAGLRPAGGPISVLSG